MENNFNIKVYVGEDEEIKMVAENSTAFNLVTASAVLFVSAIRHTNNKKFANTKIFISLVRYYLKKLK